MLHIKYALKHLFVFFVLSLALMLSVTANAETYSGDCGGYWNDVSWTLDTETQTLTIQGDGRIDDFFSVSPWIEYSEHIKTVDIKSGVTHVGNYAFYQLTSLEEVRLADTVQSIGTFSFQDCSSLRSINIPSGVTAINGFAFYNCSSLTEIQLPDSVTSIGTYAFANCTSIKNVVLGNEITLIQDSAFNGCNSLSSITLPNNVTSIGSYAFKYCSALTSITIPDSVTNIGYDAFAYCTGLSEVVIGDGVKSLYGFNFYNSTSLTSIVLGDGITSIDYNAFKGCTKLKNIVFGNSITSIGIQAFDGCSSLTQLTIPDSVTSIGQNAFAGCSSLQKLTVPFVGDSLSSPTKTYIGFLFGAQSYSTNSTYMPKSLTSITLTQATDIDEKAFYGCSKITSITLPDTLDRINNCAFEGCYSLTSINIPSSVSVIGSCAFSGCSALCDIEFEEGTVPLNVGPSIFEKCTSLKKALFPRRTVAIGLSVFSGCSNLEEINITFKSERTASSYTLLGGFFGTTSYTNAVFVKQSYSSSLSSVTYYIPNTLKKVTVMGGDIYYGAFSSCGLISSIILEDGITSIGENAFSGCRSITSISVPESVTKIGKGAFSSCSALESITLPFVGGTKGITKPCEAALFGYIFGTKSHSESTAVSQYYYDPYSSGYPYYTYTFYIPKSLRSVTVLGEIIHEHALYNCSMITEITIGDKVSGIGAGAFENCSALTKITISDQVSQIDSSAFYKATNATLYVYEGSAAHTYAKEHSIPHQLFHLGDIDFDGELTNTDITLFVRYLCGWDENITLKLADTNLDGKINNRDVLWCIRKLSGWFDGDSGKTAQE